MEYDPSLDQEAFHFATDEKGELIRIKLGAGGERAGKSKSAAAELMSRIFWGNLFWIVGPDYEQARNEFRYVLDWLKTLGLVKDKEISMPLQGSWTLRTIWGTEVVTKSGKEPATLAGRAPDGILMVEAGQQSYEAYLRCSGRIAEKRGWLCINGTFEGSTGWYPDKWWEWQSWPNPDNARSFSLPTWGNDKLYPGGRTDPEILRLESSYPPDKFQERFGGVPCKPSGLVYKELDYGKHVRMFQFGGQVYDIIEEGVIPVPKQLPVSLWIDPGYAGYSVLFAIPNSNDAYVVDEVFTVGKINEDVIESVTNHFLWPRVERVVMDIAGSQHHGSKSPADVWTALTGLRPKMQKWAVPDQILRVRSMLRVDPLTNRPHLFISPKCKRLLKEMQELYKYDVDDLGNVTKEVPIPENNHACTAMAYGLLDTYGTVSRLRHRGAIQRQKASWER